MSWQCPGCDGWWRDNVTKHDPACPVRRADGSRPDYWQAFAPMTEPQPEPEPARGQPATRAEARRLRGQGLSYREIAARLGYQAPGSKGLMWLLVNR